MTDQPQAANLLAAYLAQSSAVHLVVTDAAGRIRDCNRPILDCLRTTSDELCGALLWDRLEAPDAEQLMQRLFEGPGLPGTRMLLHFGSATSAGIVLDCSIEVLAEGLLIAGVLPGTQASCDRRTD